jgi:thioredoxin 1
MKPTIEINETNFDTEILKSPRPVIVDFSADWCGPCKMLAPVLDQIAVEQVGRAKVTKVNVDENPSLAQRYHIQGLPTLLYFDQGIVRDQTVGLASKKAILQKLEALTQAE